MSAKRVTLGNGGMIKVSVHIPHKAQALHQPPRAIIGCGGEGDDLRELERLESKSKRFPRRPGGQSPAPEFPTKPPADLDARRERSGEAWSIQAGESGKHSIHLDRP